MTLRRVMLAAVVVAFPVGTVHAKRKPMHVEVVSLAVNSDTCCLTYRVVPASAGRLPRASIQCQVSPNNSADATANRSSSGTRSSSSQGLLNPKAAS